MNLPNEPNCFADGAPSAQLETDLPPKSRTPFASFWMGGFEGADHVNGQGDALDMACGSGHLDRLEEDHARAAAHGLCSIRESIGWRLAEPSPGCFDLARVERIAASAERHGLQVIWTLMHYGTPADVDVFDDALVGRFAAFAAAVARTVGRLGARPPIYNLVNEIGFLAWAVSATNLIHPYRAETDGAETDSETDSAECSAISGYAVKRRLVQAVLAGMAAVRQVDPRARFLHVEPVVHVVAPPGRPDLADEARRIAGFQWQAWDMIEGRLEPALGGHRGALDLIGVNHYHSSQWELLSERRLGWHERDPRWRPFAELLGDVWARYRRPMIVAETSHVGTGRADWLHEMAHEVQRARRAGLQVEGLCLYPVVDRPDWNDAAHWHHSGLWDVEPPAVFAPAAEPAAPTDAAEPAAPTDAAAPAAQPFTRRLNSEYAAALTAWQAVLPEHTTTQEIAMPHLIVFSHLRWAFVYQRPQHLMSRLGQHYPVLFVEEPVFLDPQDGPARIDRIPKGPGVEVLVPRTPVPALGFHDDQLSVLEPLLTDYLREHAVDDYLVWFYTPMALPLLSELQPRAVVYDCMDELSAFKHAPRQLRQREAALMKCTDLVFTGGPSLYEAKRHLHPAVHCLPSSVDAAHFAPANLDPDSDCARAAARLQAELPGPRLGFFGVIDERLDLGLVDALARARPEWEIVMVGPVVKIDPATLPQHPNLHWLGMQPYAVLPHLVAGWAVCLMPFALNDATRFISPTKTLEYFAGGKPVVSTAVHDVIASHGMALRIGFDHADFLAACEAVLQEDEVASTARRDAMAATVRRSSWDHAAARVQALIEGVLNRPAAEGRGTGVDTDTDAVVEVEVEFDEAFDGMNQPVTAINRAARQARQRLAGAGSNGLAEAVVGTKSGAAGAR